MKGRKGKKNRRASIRRKQRGGAAAAAAAAAASSGEFIIEDGTMTFTGDTITSEIVKNQLLDSNSNLLKPASGLSRVTNVYLYSVKFSDNHTFESFLLTIPKLTVLTTLKLVNNSIGDAAATVLAEFLPSLTALRTLNLGHNSIGAAGVTALAAALPKLTALTTLDLGGNSIGRAGARALAAALRRGVEDRPLPSGPPNSARANDSK